MTAQRFPIQAATLAVAALLGLAACDRHQDDATVGQKAESTIAKVEQKTEQAATGVREAAEAVRTGTGQAIDSAADKVKDAAITAGVNAELTRDATLSAFKIDVDTSHGRVAMRGTAPDAAARERATLLARRVDGVVSVDNQLQVR